MEDDDVKHTERQIVKYIYVGYHNQAQCISKELLRV